MPTRPKLPPFPPPLPKPPFAKGETGYIYDDGEKCWWRVKVVEGGGHITPKVKKQLAAGAAPTLYTVKVLEGRQRGQVVTIVPDELKTPKERRQLQKPEDVERCWQTENLRLTSGETVHRISKPSAQETEQDRLARWEAQAFPK